MKKPFLLVVITALLAVDFAVVQQGCATAGPRHTASVISGVSLGALDLIRDTELEVICGRSGAPEAPACVTTELHHSISLKLREAFRLEADLTDVLISVPDDKENPKVLELVAKISTLINDIVALFPSSNTKAALAKAVAK